MQKIEMHTYRTRRRNKVLKNMHSWHHLALKNTNSVEIAVVGAASELMNVVVVLLENLMTTVLVNDL